MKNPFEMFQIELDRKGIKEYERKKVVKKEKQQIYLILLSVMDEHKVISDHEVETDDT